MPVMHRVLVPADQSRQRVGEFVRVPDLHTVGMKPSFHPLADQSAMHRVGATVNVDETSRIDSTTHLEATRQTHIRQTPQRRDFFGETISPRFVANRHHILEELTVLFAAGELPTPTQQQRLIDCGFEVAVRRFGIAVLVGFSGIDPLASQTVVCQQIAVSGLEFPRRRVVVHRCGETVAAMPSRHATECVQGVLQSIGEGLERFGQANAHRFPVRVGEDEMVDHVVERLACDGDGERIHVCEVRSGEIANVMHLSDDGELARTVAGPPLANAAFKGAFVGIEELTGMSLAEPGEERLGQEPRLGGEFGLYLVPNGGEGV